VIALPRLKSEDVEPILMLISALDKTKNKRVQHSIVKMIESYCKSLSTAGLTLHQTHVETSYKPGQIVPKEVKSTSWFR
jgi:hypothetical protein